MTDLADEAHLADSQYAAETDPPWLARWRHRASVSALLAAAIVLAGCQGWPPERRPVSAGHIDTALPPITASESDAIPAPVAASSFVPEPLAEVPDETYTVVVNQVPLDELLFALARDASINVDVHPDVQGNITLNAIDQTLTQILDRIGRQVPIRYEERNSTLLVLPDSPFLRSYRLDYVNLTRTSTSSISSSTNVASGATGAVSGGEGENSSEHSISGSSDNKLWETVEGNILSIVAGESNLSDGDRVIVSRESGIIMVRGTALQHELVEEYLARIRESVNRQVLIEATIVEVDLSDRFQAGVDWLAFTRNAGLGLGQAGITIGTALTQGFDADGAVSGLVLSGRDAAVNDPNRSIDVSVRLLNEFGDVRVLSSPKIMALNNQPAVLKVVDNEVYFTLSVEEEEDENTGDVTTTIESQINTVPIGLVMSVTPQIDRSGMVTMNVRPTITRIREFRQDPGVAILASDRNAPIISEIPVVQVRETETVLRVGSTQTAVIGGLMQDRIVADDEAIPGAADIPGIGDLFKFRDRQQRKTELVVFLRPTVITTPDIDADLRAFRQYLPENLGSADMLPTPIEPFDPAKQP